MTPRSCLRIGLLLALALALSCAGSRGRAPVRSKPGALMGVYRAAVADASGRERKFRLLLYAAPPDRVHGEILSPVGTTEVILDGGAGRVMVGFPRDRVVYSGQADRQAFEKLLGLEVSLAELVGTLLGDSTANPGLSVTRHPPDRQGLPRSLEIRGGAGLLTLRLKRLRPLRSSTDELGTGSPPPGMEVRPLAELPRVDLPREGVTGEDGR